MNPCVKTEGKSNESVNNEFNIRKNRDSLHEIMSEQIERLTRRIHV